MTASVAVALAMRVAFVAAPSACGQLPFFPGAEGFGGSWSGTAPAGGWLSDATVYHVTNLNDSGAGSLRGAFVENSKNRIIVFDVAGTIQLTSGSLNIKNLANYYIAGQTAPGTVTVYGDSTQLTHSSGKENRNVAVRYLSFRKGLSNNDDSITFAGGGLGTNLILDHVSASWSEDEVLSVANNNTNVTVQYATIHDALVNSHAYGSLIRPQIDSNVTFHHNLYAHNASRQARFGTYNAETLTADFRNNVIYNFRDRASYAGGSSDPDREAADVNYVGNYVIAGPGTTGNTSRAFSVDRNIDVRAYQQGNLVDGDMLPNPSGLPNGADTGWAAFGFGGLGSPPQTLTQLAAPIATAPVTTQTALEAFKSVIGSVGNSAAGRDAIDQRVINNVLNFTGPAIGAAAPPADELAELLARPMTTRPAGYDSDNDGMPDAWEIKHGLNPNSPAGSPDWRLDFDNDGYINLAEFINEAGEFAAPAPIVFTGAASNRYAEILNWRTDDGVTAGSPWQPGALEDAVIRSGTAAIDAVGQRAGNLYIDPNDGGSADLNVTGGWLEISQTLHVLSGDTAAINQTGGEVRANQVQLGGAFSGVAAYNLSGGTLIAQDFVEGVNGDFHVTGGTVVVETFLTGFENNGGTLAVPDSTRATVIMGAFANTSGAIQLDVAGGDIGQFDRIYVDNTLTAGGVLAVQLTGGYTPTAGTDLKLLDFAEATGEFSLDLPGLPAPLQWNASNLLTTGELSVVQAADFNADGAVTGTDLLIWQRGVGLAGQQENSRGDANGDGTVDGLDLAVWQAQMATGAAASAGVGVPEPAAAALATWFVVAAGIARSRPR
jgi:hypothetical protein